MRRCWRNSTYSSMQGGATPLSTRSTRDLSTCSPPWCEFPHLAVSNNIDEFYQSNWKESSMRKWNVDWYDVSCKKNYLSSRMYKRTCPTAQDLRTEAESGESPVPLYEHSKYSFIEPDAYDARAYNCARHTCISNLTRCRRWLKISTTLLIFWFVASGTWSIRCRRTNDTLWKSPERGGEWYWPDILTKPCGGMCTEIL